MHLPKVCTPIAFVCAGVFFIVQVYTTEAVMIKFYGGCRLMIFWSIYNIKWRVNKRLILFLAIILPRDVFYVFISAYKPRQFRNCWNLQNKAIKCIIHALSVIFMRWVVYGINRNYHFCDDHKSGCMSHRTYKMHLKPHVFHGTKH